MRKLQTNPSAVTTSKSFCQSRLPLKQRHNVAISRLISKWNFLFDGYSTEWIAFRPELGLSLYTCYACRHMFASKLAFQDHVNRRVALITYQCTSCSRNVTFYNRCAMLLHAREHFSLRVGRIDLNKLNIETLPIPLAGFLPHPNISPLYEDMEIYSEEDEYINVQFYKPDPAGKGKSLVILKPSDLLFNSKNSNNEVTQLALKQICVNIPLCLFIPADYQKELRRKALLKIAAESNAVRAADNPQESPMPRSPVISTAEPMEETVQVKCPECQEVLPEEELQSHFIGNNIPFDEALKCNQCKYIAPTHCSHLAHQRLHGNQPPYICPECGSASKSVKEFRYHIEIVCYHTVKQVRFRCPGKNCGKLFALTETFLTHFQTHITEKRFCSVCLKSFPRMCDFVEHASEHNYDCHMLKTSICEACKTSNKIPDGNVTQHILTHISDRSRTMYIYTCRHCKNYFRSSQTYYLHKLKCPKVVKDDNDKKRTISFSLNIMKCKSCFKSVIRYNEGNEYCPNCQQIWPINKEDGKSIKKNKEKSVTEKNKITENIPPTHDETEKTVEKRPTSTEENEEVSAEEIMEKNCILCEEKLAEENENYHKTSKCKYRNPQVGIQLLDESLVQDRLNQISTNSENVEVTPPNSAPSSPLPKTQDSSSKKKRKRFRLVAGRSIKRKLSPTNEEADLQADEPIRFEGTYHCKVCEFQNEERLKFHEHIIAHRNISTSYQCMECGECFVVEPSLTKHLMHYHGVEDTAEYLKNNNCFDKNAIEELKEALNLAPGETRAPVKENQCRVCLMEFDNSVDYNKHFRIHGMAFLMKSMK